MFDEVVFESARAKVARQVSGPLANNVYVVTCCQTGQKIAIDAAQQHVDGAERALITHGHHDHITAARQLRDAGVELLIGNADSNDLAVPHGLISDGDIFEVGNLSLRAIHTPGHTPGSTCFEVIDEAVLFSGDTLFPGGPGATRFANSSFEDIIESIRLRLFTMSNETLVLPGHGEPTTIGAESPHLSEWIARGW